MAAEVGPGGALSSLDPFDNSNEFQHFRVRFQNNAAAIQHRFFNPQNDGVAPTKVSGVNSPSNTFSNTPNGADASTAFLNGIKIGNPNPHIVWFDTPDLVAPSDLGIMGAVVRTNDNLVLYPIVNVTSININGVTRSRLNVEWRNGVDSSYSINTTNLTASQFIDLVMGIFGGYVVGHREGRKHKTGRI